MAGYKIKNLKDDVEDSAVKFGLSPNLEAHFATRPLELESSGISFQRLAPGFRVPFGHKHERQEELYVVVSGSGRLKLDEDVIELRQWDAVRIASDTMRGVEAGPEGMEILAYGAPNTGVNDAELTQEWWGE